MFAWESLVVLGRREFNETIEGCGVGMGEGWCEARACCECCRDRWGVGVAGSGTDGAWAMPEAGIRDGGCWWPPAFAAAAATAAAAAAAADEGELSTAPDNGMATAAGGWPGGWRFALSAAAAAARGKTGSPILPETSTPLAEAVPSD
jgi:hypothetical protein